jgi:hypothetical protein
VQSGEHAVPAARPPHTRIRKTPDAGVDQLNPERVAALVYPDDAIAQLAEAAGWKSSPSDSIAASLVDEKGQHLLGTSPGSAAVEASRSLAAAQIPWHIRVATTGNDSSHVLFVGRKKYLILGLVYRRARSPGMLCNGARRDTRTQSGTTADRLRFRSVARIPQSFDDTAAVDRTARS